MAPRKANIIARNDILENLLNTILEQLSADEYGDFNKFVDNSVKIDSFNDHMAVFEAIQRRDPLLAKDIMYRHLFARMNVINPDYGTNLTYSEKIRDNRLEKKKCNNYKKKRCY